MRTRPMASRPVALPSTIPVRTTPNGAPLGRSAPARTQAATAAPAARAHRARRSSGQSLLTVTSRGEDGGGARRPLARPEALPRRRLDVGALLAVLGRRPVAVPVDLAGVHRGG